MLMHKTLLIIQFLTVSTHYLRSLVDILFVYSISAASASSISTLLAVLLAPSESTAITQDVCVTCPNCKKYSFTGVTYYGGIAR